VGFRPNPSSDVARALGVHTLGAGTHDLPLDALAVDADGREFFGVNMVVVGTAPDRTRSWTRASRLRVEVDGRPVHDGPATGVVVASGQYLRGNDVVPRGHPGDGRLEVQVYSVAPRERAGVRARLPQGVHVPHPGITQSAGRRVQVLAAGRPLALEVDGLAAPAAVRVTVELVPEAFVLVV
jgi:diacylglycerol kinase family enzyme